MRTTYPVDCRANDCSTRLTAGAHTHAPHAHTHTHTHTHLHCNGVSCEYWTCVVGTGRHQRQGMRWTGVWRSIPRSAFTTTAGAVSAGCGMALCEARTACSARVLGLLLWRGRCMPKAGDTRRQGSLDPLLSETPTNHAWPADTQCAFRADTYGTPPSDAARSASLDALWRELGFFGSLLPCPDLLWTLAPRTGVCLVTFPSLVCK